MHHKAVRFLVAVAVIAGISLTSVMVAHTQRPKPKSRMLAGALLYEVLDFDAIPAIDHPEFIKVSEVGDLAEPDELFLGIAVGDEAHAYSTWFLERHEIVNDEVGGWPIAASW